MLDIVNTTELNAENHSVTRRRNNNYVNITFYDMRWLCHIKLG